MSYTTENIRNIALLGQGASGKTLLCESILSVAGAIDTKGEIARKNTVSDFDALEKNHQRSLNSSIMSTDHKGAHINLIDTPGYSDFVGPAISAIPAVETVAVVIGAQTGVETMTRRVMEAAQENNVCRMIIVNRFDAEDIDLGQIYSSIQEEFGTECQVLNLPNSGGVTACFPNAGEGSDFSNPEEARTSLIEQIVEVDEVLMEQYLEGEDIDQSALVPALQHAMRKGHLVPVCFTCAETDAGVSELLDIMADFLPNPKQGNAPNLISSEGGEAMEVAADSQGALIGHIFKVLFDPFVGKLGIFRIYQGNMNKNTAPFIGDNRKPIRIGNLYAIQGKQLIDQDEGVAGDIRGISKVDEVEYDAIIHDSSEGAACSLKTAGLPTPMVGLAIDPANRGDEQKVAESLQKVAIEDPCIVVERDPDANETVMRGLGELHLRIALERLKEVYGVEVTTSVPTIPYRETITKTAEGHCRHKKQTGGAGQFGEVYMRVEAMPRGGGFEFVDNIVGGVIPAQFIPAVEKGVRQVLQTGAFAGFPIQDIRVVIYDGKHHSVDSKEIAFITAGRKAFVDAISKAGPIVLEPIADISVDAPSASMGDIAGELSARRGRIVDTDSLAGGSIRIKGAAPLAEMTDFQSRLNAITGGEGSFIMEFSSYEPAPMELQKKLSASFSQPDAD